MAHTVDKARPHRPVLVYLLPYALLLTAGLALYLWLDYGHQKELLRAREQLQT